MIISSKSIAIGVLALLVLTALSAPVPEEYSVTDITGWSSENLAGLPAFKRYVPIRPTGADPNFKPVATGALTVAGNLEINTTWNQGNGAYVRDGIQETITSFGTFYWERLYWDGTDWHFSNGRINHCYVHGMNDLGQIVGEATVEGRGDQSIGYRTHAWLVNTPGTSKIDLTPDASFGSATGINNVGTIVGSLVDGGGSHGFRRTRGGAIHLFVELANTSAARAVNEADLVVGRYNTNYFTPRPFASIAGADMVDMGLPRQASPNSGMPNDLNVHGVAVGAAWKSDAPHDRQAVRWHRDDAGHWIAEDLNELLADEDFLLENAIAINDAGDIIANGRPDGSDAFGSGTYFLTPDVMTPTLEQPCVLEIEQGSNGDLVLTWPSSIGFRYTVYSTTDWMTWTPISQLNGTGGSITARLSGIAAEETFFRLSISAETE